MMMFNNLNQNKLYEAWAQTVFKASKLITDTVGLGFRQVWQDIFNYIQKYISFNNISKDAWILVLNDFDLTATKALREMGYYNIIMLVTDTTPEQTTTTYFFDVKFNDRKFKKLFPNGWSEIWKDVWFMNAVEVHNSNTKGKLLKSTHIEYKIQGDTTKVNFDLIIANLPYGKIGANITKTIIDKVNFDEYVNLLPANDYKRNTTNDLYNYQSDMESINDGFEDAAVTTHLARIHKTKVNDMTLDEFERSNYIDRSLDKYFEENSKRSHYAIDMPKELHRVKDPDITKIIFIAHRDINHKHFPYNKLAQANFINLNLGDYKTVCNKFIMKSAKEKGEIYFLGNCYVFNTAAEKTNMSNFIYSEKGFKFCSKVFTSMNVDGRQTIKNVMPKVDWTRAWTVEEILADYGYTEEEITEVMADLNAVDANGKPKYKGMED